MNRIWILAAVSIVLGCGLLSDLSGTRCNPDGFCGEGLVCLEGRCETGCGALTDCGGYCVDLQQDPLNCGMCQTACSEGWSCTAGACAEQAPDAGSVEDAGERDAGTSDAGTSDAGETDAGTADAGQIDPDGPFPLCDGNGWCWDNPKTPAEDLLAVHDFGPDHIWAVGQMGFAMRWNGKYWTSHPLPFGGAAAYGIHGLATDDVWVVGVDGMTAHWNGSAWQPYPLKNPRNLYAVWMISSKHVVAVGKGGMSAVWNGADWVESALPDAVSYYALWGDGNGNVYAVGDGGKIARYEYKAEFPDETDGGKWNSDTSGTTATLFAVSGNDDLVYAAGSSGRVIVKPANQNWMPKQTPPALASAEFRAAHVDRDGTLWAGTSNGRVLRVPAEEDSQVDEVHSSVNTRVRGLRAFGDGHALVVGHFGLIGWTEPKVNEGAWRSELPGDAQFVIGVAAGADNVWALSKSNWVLTREASGSWVPTAQPSFTARAIATDPDGEYLWVVGEHGIAWTKDGASLTYVTDPLNADYESVFSPTSGKVVLAGQKGGSEGVLLSCDTGGCTDIDSGYSKKPLKTVWAAIANEFVWASGASNEVIVCHDGDCSDGWVGPGSAPDVVNAIWGRAGNDVWLGGASGGKGVALNWNGTAFTEAKVSHQVMGICGDANETWVVGDSGLLARLDGGEFVPEERTVNYLLLGISLTDEAVWVSGDRGTILRRDRSK